MSIREELELILNLIKKHHLPLSPILEYAIKEKLEKYGPVKETDVQMGSNITTQSVQEGVVVSYDDVPNDRMKIVDYSERSIAVIGNTKPYKDDLKTLGGYFVYRTQWGPAWIFRSKKRDIIQAFIDGDTSVVSRPGEGKTSDGQRIPSSRYILSVEYPNGRVFRSNLVWETLVDVIKYADPKKVMDLNIICMGDNLVSPRLNENPRYRSAQKEVGGGLYVCAYSSTDNKLNQIKKISKRLHLGLKVEKIDTFNE